MADRDGERGRRRQDRSWEESGRDVDPDWAQDTNFENRPTGMGRGFDREWDYRREMDAERSRAGRYRSNYDRDWDPDLYRYWEPFYGPGSSRKSEAEGGLDRGRGLQQTPYNAGSFHPDFDLDYGRSPAHESEAPRRRDHGRPRLASERRQWVERPWDRDEEQNVIFGGYAGGSRGWDRSGRGFDQEQEDYRT